MNKRVPKLHLQLQQLPPASATIAHHPLLLASEHKPSEPSPILWPALGVCSPELTPDFAMNPTIWHKPQLGKAKIPTF